MKKHLIVLIGLLVVLCWSCSKSDEPPFEQDLPDWVNPWIDPLDTTVIDGKIYFNGSMLTDHDVILTKITRLEKATVWGGAVFSMTNNKENCFGYKFAGECCDARYEPQQYIQLLIDSVKARPARRPLPYNAVLGQMPIYPSLYELGLDGIDEISIITETDFNAEHPAGSSLNNICSLSISTAKPLIDIFKNWQPEYPVIEDIYGIFPDELTRFLDPYRMACQSNKRPLHKIDYSDTQWLNRDGFCIWVDGFPSKVGNYKLTVTIKLHSGGTLEFEQLLVYGDF